MTSFAEAPKPWWSTGELERMESACARCAQAFGDHRATTGQCPDGDNSGGFHAPKRWRSEKWSALPRAAFTGTLRGDATGAVYLNMRENVPGSDMNGLRLEDMVDDPFIGKRVRILIEVLP